jgi:hypothetical protein
MERGNMILQKSIIPTFLWPKTAGLFLEILDEKNNYISSSKSKKIKE